jgi:hypothetical protein
LFHVELLWAARGLVGLRVVRRRKSANRGRPVGKPVPASFDAQARSPRILHQPSGRGEDQESQTLWASLQQCGGQCQPKSSDSQSRYIEHMLFHTPATNKPTTKNQQPTTKNQQPTTKNQQPTTSNSFALKLN